MNTKKSLYLVIVPLVSLLIVCVLLIMTNIAIKAQTVNSPRILASYQHNTIGFEEFTANTNLSFEIYSSPDGDLLHAETLHTDSTGFAYFRGWSSFDIQVGQHIIANDGVTTKDLLVANVRYDVLDIDYDQARGIAPPGSQVGVYVHRLGDDHELSTQTGQNGTWVADFGADGQDILSYVSTNANTYDNDGDATIAWAPNFSVWNYAGFYVEGQSFTSGGMITVEIYDSLGGTLLYSAADIVAESDQGRFVIPFWQHLQNLQAGVHVVVIDQTSGEDRQLILQSLNLDIFDYETEVIQGTAPAGSTVFVHGGEHEIITEVGADNNWSVDFNTEGANLNPSDDVYVTLYDLDGDAVRTGLRSFLADSAEDFIHWSWIPAPITVSIYDPNGEIVFGPQEFVDSELGIFTQEYGIDLQPGYYIDIDYGSGRIIDVTLADLSIDNVDRDTNRAEGSAPPNSTVTVLVYDLDGAYFAGFYVQAVMDVPADGNGYWEADFSSQGFDITQQHNVAITFTEIDGGTSGVAALMPSNTSPLIELIHSPTSPVPVNTEMTLSADFNDPDPSDAHTATWDWGDGTTSNGSVDEGNGTVSGSHTYTQAGIYTLSLTLCDAASECDIAIYQYIIVYDPEGGFVTGGGWIDSPVNEEYEYMQVGGKANFGFVSKYKKGVDVPEGNTEFQFMAGNLNFHSDHYKWLVVTGSKYAKFMGKGTINGEGFNGELYRFQVWAGDNTPDTFRIKIWWEDTNGEHVVYDNGMYQAIGGGSIVIHTN